MHIPINEIKYILLDLDGTLLDKNFDDEFWLKLVPKRYGEVHGMSTKQAGEFLFATYMKHEGTLNWTDLDFWSEELGLNIISMKEELWDLINPLPHAVDFLGRMNAQGKAVHLLTNAHRKSVNLKFKKTGIGIFFDKVLTSNELGSPKEDEQYWVKAQQITGFDPALSLFVDDTETVLSAAQDYGIKYVLHKARSSTVDEPVLSQNFKSITDFNELI